mmetsp:Transcript_44710/g.106380  ORF Transcript_44710/g.106380 Transcript_44710/m.106380 type:complete len:205 (+) Transcript_44710:686-1300(+)
MHTTPKSERRHPAFVRLVARRRRAIGASCHSMPHSAASSGTYPLHRSARPGARAPRAPESWPRCHRRGSRCPGSTSRRKCRRFVQLPEQITPNRHLHMRCRQFHPTHWNQGRHHAGPAWRSEFDQCRRRRGRHLAAPCPRSSEPQRWAIDWAAPRAQCRKHCKALGTWQGWPCILGIGILASWNLVRGRGTSPDGCESLHSSPT